MDTLTMAAQEGRFLEVLSEYQRQPQEDITNKIISLHNEKKIDVISEFLALKKGSRQDFFSLRHVFEQVLPNLEDETSKVMTVVLHLVNEAGNDLVASATLNSFMDFLLKEGSRIEKSLMLIKENPQEWLIFIAPVIHTGTKRNLNKYIEEALLLVENDNIDVRCNAAYSLSGIGIDYQQDTTLLNKVLLAMRSLLNSGTDDSVIRNIIISTFHLYKQNSALLEEAVNIMADSIDKGGKFSLNALYQLFRIDTQALPDELLNLMRDKIDRVNVKDQGTLEHINVGIYNLIKNNRIDEALLFFEQVLLKIDQIDTEKFKSTIYQLEWPIVKPPFFPQFKTVGNVA